MEVKNNEYQYNLTVLSIKGISNAGITYDCYFGNISFSHPGPKFTPFGIRKNIDTSLFRTPQNLPLRWSRLEVFVKYFEFALDLCILKFHLWFCEQKANSYHIPIKYVKTAKKNFKSVGLLLKRPETCLLPSVWMYLHRRTCLNCI